MSTLSDLRDGLAAALTSISGLRVYDVIPENPAPPCAVVTWQRVEANQAMGPRTGAVQQVSVEVIILAQRADSRTGQNLLDSYCSPDGQQSIYAAVRADKTLGGKVVDAVVEAVDNTGQLLVGDVPYLSASAQIRVLV